MAVRAVQARARTARALGAHRNADARRGRGARSAHAGEQNSAAHGYGCARAHQGERGMRAVPACSACMAQPQAQPCGVPRNERGCIACPRPYYRCARGYGCARDRHGRARNACSASVQCCMAQPCGGLQRGQGRTALRGRALHAPVLTGASGATRSEGGRALHWLLSL